MTKAKEAAPVANDISEKTQEVNTEDRITQLEAENKSLKAVIGELNAAIAAKDGELEQKGGFPIIKDGKDSYELRLKRFICRIDAKAVEVDEQYLKDHPEVVKELIAKKSGALVKKGGK